MQIRIVRGSATAETRLASYDAALADANVHNYNLVTVSSVIPADAGVEVVGTAPDLGPAGHELTVVEACATSADEPVHAALAWAQSAEGPGLVYEAAGSEPPETVRNQAERGLATGQDLRDWTFEADNTAVSGATSDDGEDFATAVVLAVYGRGCPIR